MQASCAAAAPSDSVADLSKLAIYAKYTKCAEALRVERANARQNEGVMEQVRFASEH